MINNNIKKILLYLIIFFLIIGILYFGIKLLDEYNSNRSNEQIRENLLSFVKKDNDESYGIPISDNNNITIFNNKNKDNNEIRENFNFLKIDFNPLVKKNNECVGWIYIPNTKINYPIVKHNDNNFYLNHDFYKNRSNAGWIFGDYRCNFNELGYNTVIYGHNRKDLNMFGELHLLLNENFFNNKDNNYIYFNTLNKTYVAKIFSIYEDNPNNIDNQSGFKNNQDFEQFLSLIKNKNIIKTIKNNNVTSNNKILTLSTCSGNKRLIIHAFIVSCRLSQ